jgi:hypothetical protein
LAKIFVSTKAYNKLYTHTNTLGTGLDLSISDPASTINYSTHTHRLGLDWLGDPARHITSLN